MIFDSHAHYDDESFDEDREKVIKELKENNIVGVLNCGASFKGAVNSVKLSNKYDFFYAAVGIHPEYADKLDEKMIEELRQLAKEKKVKAIGEIGLDYYYDENPEREIQKNAFIRQMELAQELKLPVIIHDREAHQDTLNIIKQFPSVKGEIHCFSGSVEFAKQCLELGYYIGITGVVTFKNAKKIIEVIREVPMERIVVETDCPYMSPTPYRGKRNRSEYIEYILRKIAEIKRLSLELVKEVTVSNSQKLLKIEK